MCCQAFYPQKWSRVTASKNFCWEMNPKVRTGSYLMDALSARGSRAKRYQHQRDQSCLWEVYSCYWFWWPIDTSAISAMWGKKSLNYMSPDDERQLYIITNLVFSLPWGFNYNFLARIFEHVVHCPQDKLTLFSHGTKMQLGC